MNLLTIQGLQSGYGKIPVLFGINLDVAEKEIVAVVGPNGAGKSTLMRTVMGVLPPTDGAILYRKESLVGMEPCAITRKRIGYVPQTRNVFPDLTVLENLEMGAFLLDHPKEKIETVYHRFPILKERSKQKAGTLSGGERQMLAIGCALLIGPELLILDEPTTGLSPAMVNNLIEKIFEINDEGTAILWVVEENPKKVLEHAQRAYLIESGVVRKATTAQALLEDENFEQLFLGKH